MTSKVTFIIVYVPHYENILSAEMVSDQCAITGDVTITLR